MEEIVGLIRCFVPEVAGVYDSVCLEDVNVAMRFLAGRGLFEVVYDDGSRMKGRLVTVSDDPGGVGAEIPGVVPIDARKRSRGVI